MMAAVALFKPATVHRLACLDDLSLADSTRERFLKSFGEALEALTAQEASAGVIQQEQEEARQACLLFVARTLHLLGDDTVASSLSGNQGMPLSRIVSASATNLFDFFRELPIVVAALTNYLSSRGSSSRDLEAATRITEWQRTLVSSTILTKKYKDLFNQLLHQLPQYKQVVLRFGWTLYLVLKIKLLPSFPDLVSCTDLLACVMNVLVMHMPLLPEVLRPVPGEDAPVDTLRRVAGVINSRIDMGTVRPLMASVDALLGQLLPTCVAEWRHTGAKVWPAHAQELDTSCSKHYSGLLEDLDKLNCCTVALEKEYEAYYSRQGEIDERELLTTDFHSLMSPKQSPGSHGHTAAAGRVSFGASLHRTGSGGSKGRAASPTPVRPGLPLGPGSFTTSAVLPAMRTPTQGTEATPPRDSIRSPTGTAAAAVPPGLHSPMPTATLGLLKHTPISEALVSAAWLKGIVTGLPDGPTPALQRYFDHCKPNPGMLIVHKAAEMAAAVLPDDQPVAMPFPMAQPALAAERRAEARKLYYYALEAVLSAEERTTGQCSLPALLTSAKFHRGTMACCIEVVAATYHLVSAAFPKVLDALLLKAFDFSKMIHSFVRHIPSLPHDLKRHLFQVEEKIIEVMAWEPGSSLYSLLVSAATSDSSSDCPDGEAGQLPQQPQPSSSVVNGSGTGLPSASNSECTVTVAPSPSKRSQAAAFSALVSPLKRSRSDVAGGPRAQTFSAPFPASVGPPPPPSVPKDPASAVLHEFLRKVLKLASHRLAMLCNCFEFASLERSLVAFKVYEVVEYALYYHTSLFYNRHVDQILLSSFYGYCKVRRLGHITFRDIISHYRKQPQSSQAVFRSVVLEQSDPGLQVLQRGDIIAFYNQSYVPKMKAKLLKTAETDTPGPTLGEVVAAGVAPATLRVSPMKAHGRPPLQPTQQHSGGTAGGVSVESPSKAVAAAAVHQQPVVAQLPPKMRGRGRGAERGVPVALATLLRVLEEEHTPAEALQSNGAAASGVFQFGTITSAQADSLDSWASTGALPDSQASNDGVAAGPSTSTPTDIISATCTGEQQHRHFALPLFAGRNGTLSTASDHATFGTGGSGMQHEGDRAVGLKQLSLEVLQGYQLTSQPTPRACLPGDVGPMCSRGLEGFADGAGSGVDEAVQGDRS